MPVLSIACAMAVKNLLLRTLPQAELYTAFLLCCACPSGRLLLMPDGQLEMSDINSGSNAGSGWTQSPVTYAVSHAALHSILDSQQCYVCSHNSILQAQDSMYTRVLDRCSLE